MEPYSPSEGTKEMLQGVSGAGGAEPPPRVHVQSVRLRVHGRFFYMRDYVEEGECDILHLRTAGS